MAALLLLAGIAACDKVPLTAPTESTILLFANGSSVPLTGGVDLIATVTEKPGTPVQNGTIDPTEILTNTEPITGAIEAYEAFDTRQPGWIKVELEPTQVA